MSEGESTGTHTFYGDKGWREVDTRPRTGGGRYRRGGGGNLLTWEGSRKGGVSGLVLPPTYTGAKGTGPIR